MKKKFFKNNSAQIDMFGATPAVEKKTEEKPQEKKTKSPADKDSLKKVLESMKEIEKLVL